MEPVSPRTLTIFDQISKSTVTSYLLDYVTKEFESIIPCPSVNYQQNDTYSNNKRLRSNSNDCNDTRSKSTRTQVNSASGLPSPPLSSPDSQQLGNTYYQPPTNKVNRPPTPPLSSRAIPLRFYIESVVQKSRIDAGTLITSLSYARRLRSKLSSTSRGMECTHHRIFIATLIIASKYIHDSALKNKYWVGYAQIFSPSEINLMEKQLLQLLDYNLEIKSVDYNLIINDVVKLYLLNNNQQSKVIEQKKPQDVSNCSFEVVDHNTTVPKPTLLSRLKATTSILTSL
ncbi:hypothetical protein BD770DRAFT_427299 [Pilaira anomala]|nr:hypothetical protein BD770DRAFT_427299 [Pilaira anomala]